MRELTADDLGLLLSVFAVLLLAFATNFHFSRKEVRRHRRAAIVFVGLSFLGRCDGDRAAAHVGRAVESEGVGPD